MHPSSVASFHSVRQIHGAAYHFTNTRQCWLQFVVAFRIMALALSVLRVVSLKAWLLCFGVSQLLALRAPWLVRIRLALRAAVLRLAVSRLALPGTAALSQPSFSRRGLSGKNAGSLRLACKQSSVQAREA